MLRGMGDGETQTENPERETEWEDVGVTRVVKNFQGPCSTDSKDDNDTGDTSSEKTIYKCTGREDNGSPETCYMWKSYSRRNW